MRTTLVVMVSGMLACGAPAKAPPSSTAPPGAAASIPKGGGRFTVDYAATRDSTTLEGRIYNAATQEPMIGATLVAEGPAIVGTQTAISDETGSFSFATLPPGTYKVSAYYEDQTVTGEVVVQGGKLAKVTIGWAIDTSNQQIIKIDAEPVDFKTASEALARGHMREAIRLGDAELAKQPSSKLHGILAIARYGDALDAFRMGAFSFAGKSPTGADMRLAVAKLVGDFDKVQLHLTEAGKDPTFALELCVACMADRTTGYFRLMPQEALELEHDRAGNRLPEGDKRRTPTYRFDHGDLAWARAMLSFQQGFANVALAYDWSWIDQIGDDTGKRTTVTIKLTEPARIAKARELFIAALAASDEARIAYLAETDDDREWVPSPKQKNYASPLPVDASLYKTWEEMIGDVRILVKGDTGISLQALWTVLGSKDRAPAGFIDLGSMLTKPKDIVFELGAFDRLENEKNAAKRRQLETTLLQGLLGNGYKQTMKPSRLTDRVIKLRKDLEASDPAFEEKLKYLLWLN